MDKLLTSFNIINWKTSIALTYPTEYNIKESHSIILHRNAIIDWLRLKKKMENYFWFFKIDKNKRPHLHIITDTFIPHEEIVPEWHIIIAGGFKRDVYSDSCVEFIKDSTAITLEFKDELKKLYGKELGDTFGFSNTLERLFKKLPDDLENTFPESDLKKIQIAEEELQVKQLEIFFLESLKQKHKENNTYSLVHLFVQKYSSKHTEAISEHYKKIKWKSKPDYNEQLHKELFKEFFNTMEECPTYVTVALIFSILSQEGKVPFITFLKNVALNSFYKVNRRKDLEDKYGQGLLTELATIVITCFVKVTDGKIKIGQYQETQDAVPLLNIEVEDQVFLEISRKLSTELISAKLLPMVCKPNHWSFDPKTPLHKNYTGGYLLNGEKMWIPLCSKNPITRHSLSIESEEIFNTINHLQDHPYSIHKETFKYWKERNYIYCEKKHEKISQNLLKIKENLKGRAIYNSEYKDALSALEECIQVKYFVSTIEMLEKKFPKLNRYYFPTVIDWRNRKYKCSRLNPVNNTMLRGVLDTYEKFPLDLTWFKVYASRCYYEHEKLSFEESIKKFDEHVSQVFRNFRTHEAIFTQRDYGEQLLLLRMCFEYENIENHLQRYGNLNDYKTGFLVSVDAIASGLQIITLLTKSNVYANILNLHPANKSTVPQSIYRCMSREFFKINSEFIKEFINKNLDTFNNSSDMNFKENPTEDFKIFIQKLFKSLIMKGAYGLTYHGYKNDNVIQSFKEKGLLKKKNNEFIKKFTKLSWDFVRKSPLFIFVEIMKIYASALSKLELSVKWSPQEGVCIVQDYGKQKPIVKSYIDLSTRKRVSITLQNPDPQGIDINKARAGLPANFIQSLDGAIITTLVKYLHQSDFNIPLITVHDMVACNSCFVDVVIKKLLEVNHDLFLGEEKFNNFLKVFDNALSEQGPEGHNMYLEVKKKVKPLLEELYKSNVFLIDDVLKAYCMYY